MSDSRPSTADEKATVVEQKPKRGFFARKTSTKPALTDPEKHDEQAPEVKAEEVTPVGFFQMFR